MESKLRTVAYRSRMGAVEIQYQAYITDETDTVYDSSPWCERPEEVDAWVAAQGF